MIRATVNGKSEFTIDKGTLNGAAHDWDCLRIDGRSFHVIRNNKSYEARLVSYNAEEKTVVLQVNGNDYTVAIRDQYDILLQQMGISNKATKKINHLKAPMPGLIIQLFAKEGDVLKKGDNLLILEAMKMENILKAPADVTIKKVHVELRIPVEKNQLLIEFE